VPTKKDVGTHPQNSHFKTASKTHFKAKSEEDVKTPFPPPTTPLQVIIAHPKLSLDKVTTKVLDTP